MPHREGAAGQRFSARTILPPPVSYVLDSGESDLGDIHHTSGMVTWTGVLGASAARASFDMLVSSQLTAPMALSTTTTLNAPGYSPLSVPRWFIVNGQDNYLPLVDGAWLD